MSGIKNVAIAGGTGNLGGPILDALVASGAFNITLLTRDASKGSHPAGVTVKEVDYSSLESIKAAVQGVDAVVNSTSQPNPAAGNLFIDALIAAGVRRYIPPDFGMDPENPIVQGLPVFAVKAVAYKYLKEKAASGDIEYTVIATGPFFDSNLTTGFIGIDMKAKKIALFNGGTNVHPWTEHRTIGHAVVQSLLKADATKNRVVYIHSMYKSQKQVAELTKEALGGTWEETEVDATATYQEAMESIKQGIINWGTLGPLIQWATANPDALSPWKRDDNDLVGITELTDDEIKAAIKKLAE